MQITKGNCGIRGFQNRVGRDTAVAQKFHRCVRTGSFHGLSYSIEYRAFEMFRATLCPASPAHNVCPVLNHLLRVKSSLTP